MAKKAAELDNTEFDVVFNAAHMLRSVVFSCLLSILFYTKGHASIYFPKKRKKEIHHEMPTFHIMSDGLFSCKDNIPFLFFV